MAGHLVEQLPGSLGDVLLVLWHCLCDMKDDLSSSVGVVMDLLGMHHFYLADVPALMKISGKLVTYDQVITILANDTISYVFRLLHVLLSSETFIRLPLATLASTLFPFFRHTIASVRLAVVKTLSAFMNVASLPRDWMAPPFLRLVFQNLIVEERSDIRDASLAAWRAAFSILAAIPGRLEATIDHQLILEWYAVVMTPFGVAVDSSSFYHPSMATEGDVTHERHNVDKNMLNQDLSLITTEVVLKARIASATALAYLITFWPSEVSFRRSAL